MNLPGAHEMGCHRSEAEHWTRVISAEEMVILQVVYPQFPCDSANPTVDVAKLEARAVRALETGADYPEVPAIYAWLLLAELPPSAAPIPDVAMRIAELTRAYLRGRGTLDQASRLAKVALAREMGRIIARITADTLRLTIIAHSLKLEWKHDPADAADVASPTTNVDYFGRMVAFWALHFKPDLEFSSVLHTMLDHSHVGIRAMAAMAILSFRDARHDMDIAEKLGDRTWVSQLTDPEYPSAAPETDAVFFVERGMEGRNWNPGTSRLIHALSHTGHGGLESLAERLRINLEPRL